MSRQKSRARGRVGKVSYYLHHGSWWIYFREAGEPQRRKIGPSREEALTVAAQINGQLATASPTMLSFKPISIPDLRRLFLEHHEHVIKSSLKTVVRYRAATQHLENFSAANSAPAHEIRPDAFAAYLRSIEVAPNGHPKARRRKLRDKGVQYILETCRAMYTFAAKRRHLPPYAGNPFAELPLDRLKIEDAKPVFVFDAKTELAFFNAADPWSLPIHFLLAKTGLRPGEAVHVLIEEVDLDGGWLHVRNKPTLGWRVKTGLERSVPLISEVVEVLRAVISDRNRGPLFLRHKFFKSGQPTIVADRSTMEKIAEARQRNVGGSLSRQQIAAICRQLWRDAGAVKTDIIRTSFLRVAAAIGRPEATCPKSWRHTFATLLQDANVDPLIRQITLGHRPTSSNGLGMTGNYTHTRPETQRQQIEAAMRLWPKTLELVRDKLKEDER